MQFNTVGRKETRCEIEGGFTLIEVLVAMAIFLIGILAVLMMHIKAINSNATTPILIPNMYPIRICSSPVVVTATNPPKTVRKPIHPTTMT